MSRKLNIKEYKDLVTSRTSTRAGFLEQAIEKGLKSDPYLIRAKKLRAALSKVKTLEDIASLTEFEDDLMAAAGFSEKALNHLSHKEKRRAFMKAFGEIISKKNFKDEIVQRYLLTKGDSLGGSMRNRIGSSAGEKLAGMVIDALNTHEVVVEKSKKDKIQSIRWDGRLLVFDHKPKLIGNNIDVILFDISGTPKKYVDKKEVNQDPKRYIACGELKGGIDPAGADEHWKTANSALGRIRASFANKGHQPFTFFVGAAIESAMAKEIFQQLKNEKLTYAANFNSKTQMNSLVNWLINL